MFSMYEEGSVIIQPNGVLTQIDDRRSVKKDHLPNPHLDDRRSVKKDHHPNPHHAVDNNDIQRPDDPLAKTNNE